jgi:hypothetical protein
MSRLDEPFRSELTDELDRIQEERLSVQKAKKKEADEATQKPADGLFVPKETLIARFIQLFL